MKVSLKFQNRTIAGFYSQIEQQGQILKIVRAGLPPDLAKHVRHCLTRNNRLLIYTESAAWGSQLRFYDGAILASIADLTKQSIDKIQIKIMAVKTGLRLNPERKALLPSPEKIDIIRADSLLVTDGELQSALLKLSATLGNLSS